MTETTTAPTADDLRAAVETLLRAWAPTAPPATPAEDDEDWTLGCSCGGEDDDGEPVCTCGDGCGCRSCAHYAHGRAKVCHLRAPREGQPYAWCGEPTRYRIVAFCTHRDGVTRLASDGDPAIDHQGQVRLGDSIQRHTATYACSTQHARALIEADREYRARFELDSPLHVAQTFYEVDHWRYEPDEVDVPGPLFPLANALGSAEYWVKSAIKATFERNRTSADHAVEALLRSLGWSVSAALNLTTDDTDSDG